MCFAWTCLILESQKNYVFRDLTPPPPTENATMREKYFWQFIGAILRKSLDPQITALRMTSHTFSHVPERPKNSTEKGSKTSEHRLNTSIYVYSHKRILYRVLCNVHSCTSPQPCDSYFCSGVRDSSITP